MFQVRVRVDVVEEETRRLPGTAGAVCVCVVCLFVCVFV